MGLRPRAGTARVLARFAIVLLLPWAACFRDPDVKKMKCTQTHGCPDGYSCVSVDGTFRCQPFASAGMDGPASVGVDGPLPPPNHDAAAAASDSSTQETAVADVAITEAMPPATGTGGGPGGASAVGGMSGSGGATGAASGGTKASGGAAGNGGLTANGGLIGSGGVTGNGGVSGRGGATGNGGVSGRGGATGNGGTTGQGGGPGVGGSGTGGVTGTGGTTGAGGTTASGGTSGCPALPSPPTGGVAGTLITFSDDGGWSWFQDERAVVDASGKKLVIGSVAFKGARAGNIEATIYDLTTGTKNGPTPIGNVGLDERNAPALVVRPDGRYVAMWAGYNQECKSYYSVHDGSAWSVQKSFDWTANGCGTTWKVALSNLWYLGTDLLSFVRSVDTSPNYLMSQDNGASWSYGGRLTSNPQVGYVAGYYKYWGNNTDRIDFLGTEGHPRDNDNSLYHGYVKGGQIYNSAGTVIDATLADTDAQTIDSYTRVFQTGTTLGGVKLEHAWNHDIVRYDDGTIAVLGQARVAGSGSSDPDKRLFYGRWDGSTWKLTYLAKLGPKLFDSEQDYTGLGALHPDNPHIVYISSVYDPSDDTTQTAKHEIYQGITCDNGATWKWVAVTKGSTMDNLRPIVPKWDANHTALLWMRGTYVAPQNMTMSIVGTISGP